MTIRPFKFSQYYTLAHSYNVALKRHKVAKLSNMLHCGRKLSQLAVRITECDICDKNVAFLFSDWLIFCHK